MKLSPGLLALLMLGAIVPTPEQAAYDELLDRAEAGVDWMTLSDFGTLVAEIAFRTHAPSNIRADPRHEHINRLRERALARWPELPTRMATGFDDQEGRWMRLIWRALTCDSATGQYGHRHIFGEAVDLLRGIP